MGEIPNRDIFKSVARESFFEGDGVYQNVNVSPKKIADFYKQSTHTFYIKNHLKYFKVIA